MADWFQLRFSRLGEMNDVDERLETLMEIKIKLASLNDNEKRDISRCVNFNSLFSLLAVDNCSCGKLTYEVLKTLFNAAEAGEILQRYPAEFVRLLADKNADVRALILDEILRSVSSPNALPIVLSNFQVLTAIVKRITANNLMEALRAMSIVKELGNYPESLKIIHSEEFLKMFSASLTKSDEVNFRIYEVIIDIARASQDGLDAIVRTGLMGRFLETLDSDDIILQLNAVGVMTDLALTDHGLRYLEEQGVLRKFIQKIENANASSSFVIPELMKLFGSIACVRPNDFLSKYSSVITVLFEVIDGGDQSSLIIALDTLGRIGSTVQGKYVLQASVDCMHMTMRKIGEIVQSTSTSLRIKCLQNMALLLEVKKSEQDNKILSLTQKWFDSTCDNPMTMLVTLCRLPEVAIHEAGLKVLAVIASQAWGQEYISAQPGLMDFLLSRTVDPCKECIQTRIEIVHQLLQAERNIFDANTMQRFNEFLNDKGPVRPDPLTVVAMESAT